MNPSRTFLILGALSGALAIGLGAFATHGLRSMIPADMLAIFETGARYQMYHALSLLFVGLIAERSTETVLRRLAIAGWCFALGTVLFSGSLYMYALLQIRWLTAFTPMGGIALLAGWVFLLASLFKK